MCVRYTAYSHPHTTSLLPHAASNCLLLLILMIPVSITVAYYCPRIRYLSCIIGGRDRDLAWSMGSTCVGVPDQMSSVRCVRVCVCLYIGQQSSA